MFTLSLWVFFPLAITLHNVEEALWLPKWSAHAAKFHRPVEAGEFYFAVILVTLLAYLSTFLALAFPGVWLWRHLFFGFLGAMILNVIFPHLIATLLLRRYAPGLLTGLGGLIPINTLILYQALVSGQTQWRDLLGAILIVSAILLSLLPVFFRIGKILIRSVESP